MSSTFKFVGLEVPAGERATETLRVPVGTDTVAVPVIAVHGAHPGPHVAVTGGIHGAEYVGIEAARRLGMEIDPQEVHGSVVVVPISNTAAFHRRSIYTSALDDNNLNRVFPGTQDGSPSERLAHWLFQNVIGPADYYIDLHGGDMIEALVPFVVYVRSGDSEVEDASRAMAIATGIPRVIRGAVGGSTYGAATAAGIPSILAEIGGQGVWSDEEVEQHRDGVMRVLRHLQVLRGQSDESAQVHENAKIHETFAWMRANVDGLLHPAVRVGDQVEQGQYVGRITDYFGNEQQRLEAVESGEVAFLVTSLAMNRGDPILAVIA